MRIIIGAAFWPRIAQLGTAAAIAKVPAALRQ